MKILAPILSVCFTTLSLPSFATPTNEEAAAVPETVAVQQIKHAELEHFNDPSVYISISEKVVTDLLKDHLSDNSQIDQEKLKEASKLAIERLNKSFYDEEVDKEAYALMNEHMSSEEFANQLNLVLGSISMSKKDDNVLKFSASGNSGTIYSAVAHNDVFKSILQKYVHYFVDELKKTTGIDIPQILQGVEDAINLLQELIETDDSQPPKTE